MSKNEGLLTDEEAFGAGGAGGDDPQLQYTGRGILLLMGIDHFLDMGRSAINVLGNGIATAMHVEK
ncbi:hypothetical protein A7K92_27520 [Klebsiella pneumoniae]|nr:hypothetical protein A7K92_27520 [Klebsiella pneumoniae]